MSAWRVTAAAAAFCFFACSNVTGDNAKASSGQSKSASATKVHNVPPRAKRQNRAARRAEPRGHRYAGLHHSRHVTRRHARQIAGWSGQAEGRSDTWFGQSGFPGPSDAWGRESSYPSQFESWADNSSQRHYGGHSFSGVASYYGYGRRTASGERFNASGMTAAHRSLPFGTHVQVTDVASGRSVVVTINDRGPFVRGRVLDLSRGAAQALGITGRGVARIRASVM
jgi:rare lipoprotein A (peptidoglycan hydrolase)